MMSKLKESLAGPGYVILNTIRALNIIVFLDIIAACAVMLVKINMYNGFFFFQAVTHAVMALISIGLIISELPFFRGFFNRQYPMFGEEAGFYALAGIMMILGVSILGNLNSKAMSQDNLGLAFWRIIISAGILAMVVSLVNVLATLIFTNHTQGLSARHVRQYGAVAPQKVVSRASSNRSFQASLNMKREDDSLPSYTPQSATKRFTKRLTGRFPIKISNPMNPTNNGTSLNAPPVNDAASSRYSRDSAGIAMPDPARHPMYHNGGSNMSFDEIEVLFLLASNMAGIGISWGTVKSLLIFFGPVLLPRLITAYRSLRVSIASRPPPRPIPAGANRALNLFFASIALFLVLSLPFNPHAPEPNIFSLTRSRINTPIDVVFHRLSRLRPDSVLTDADVRLREKLTSLGARKVYLTFGADALVSCQYCSFEDLNTYLLYYLPFHILLPHVVHLLILGVATSAPFAGREAARWRTKFTLAGLALAALDIWIVVRYDAITSASPAVRAGQVPPIGLYNLISLLRPLAFTVCDAVCAIVIYLSSTNRFFFKPPSQADQLDQAVSAALTMLTGANNKLHAASVTRNAVVRDKALKTRDDVYWQAMVAVENPTRGSGGAEQIEGVERVDVVNNIWEEEEVARAMSRAMAGQGGVDLAQLGMNANEFVRGVTEGLD
ncbi:uncharacterized protein N7496_008419 [Penicillium cataractarum]|uniref:DUF7598 domain-containing protein n=1 Tax=Penicillium cataractarum TaxID=2100454 RepID=A0A9W9S0Y7_9EURO|nr:uncharacterized protein N7496_008419 [Penicillium cataractarum]KAJ5368659.1 hypothetical protein N7496_008419 [Penicillium cataractarum]